MSPYGTSPLTNALVSSKVALTPKSIPDHYEYQLFRLYLLFRDTKYHYLLLFLVRSISSCFPQNIIFLHQYQAYPIPIGVRHSRAYPNLSLLRRQELRYIRCFIFYISKDISITYCARRVAPYFDFSDPRSSRALTCAWVS